MKKIFSFIMIAMPLIFNTYSALAAGQVEISDKGVITDANGNRPAIPSSAEALHLTKEQITVTSAYARPSMTGSNNSAAYISLHNANTLEAVIVGAMALTGPDEGASSVANRVEMHMVTVDDKNISKMIQVNRLVIPAGGDLTMKSGGIHIMLLDLKRTLKENDNIYINLIIQGIGTYQVTVPVKNM